MINWIAQQIKMALCKHTLKYFSETLVYRYENKREKGELPIRIEHAYLCEKCGFYRIIKI